MFDWLGDPAASAERRDDLWRLLGPRRWPDAAAALGGPVAGECLAHRPIALPAKDPQAATGPANPGDSTDPANTANTARLEDWRLTLNDGPAVPAWWLLPPPGCVLHGVVLYAHAHGGTFALGRDELLSGRKALQTPPYGPALAARGWASLAIDHWGFGARQVEGGERRLVKQALWQGHTLWGWRLHDQLLALRWLRQQPGMAALPVVALGLSMGSTMALWAAALAPDIAGCAELCCAAEYQSLLDSGGLDGHGEYFFVPGLLQHFTLAEICALIAPRPHLSLAGSLDPLTPLAGLRALDERLRTVYAAAGAPSAWQQQVEPVGHVETPAMRHAVLAWLDALAAPAPEGPGAAVAPG